LIPFRPSWLSSLSRRIFIVSIFLHSSHDRPIALTQPRLYISATSVDSSPAVLTGHNALPIHDDNCVHRATGLPIQYRYLRSSCVRGVSKRPRLYKLPYHRCSTQRQTVRITLQSGKDASLSWAYSDLAMHSCRISWLYRGGGGIDCAGR
jgi:hypothetical protein